MSSIDAEAASFTVDGGERITFAVVMVEENGAIRLAPRDRPYREGTKLDTTGRKGDTWNFEAPFSNDFEEEGVTDTGEVPLYPDRLQLLVDAFKTGKTGTLNWPWRRGIRAKCGAWKRVEGLDPTNAATFTGTFSEDNEDNLDREAILKPSPRAALPNTLEETVFDAESTATWSPDVASLQEFTAGLVAIISAPGEYAQQLDSLASGVLSSIAQIRDAFTTYIPGRDQFFDADSFWLRLYLLEMEDLASQAQWDARKKQRVTYNVYPTQDTDIWTIAIERKKDPSILVEMNAADIEDLGYIRKGTPVRVYQE